MEIGRTKNTDVDGDTASRRRCGGVEASAQQTTSRWSCAESETVGGVGGPGFRLRGDGNLKVWDWPALGVRIIWRDNAVTPIGEDDRRDVHVSGRLLDCKGLR